MNVRTSCLLAAVLLLAPASALGQQRGGRAETRGSILLGFEDGDGPAGIALRLDGEIPQKPLSPQVTLSIVGSLGLSRWSDHFDWMGDRTEWSTYILKLVPAARFNFGRNPKIRPYADAGVGIYYASTSWKDTVTTYDPWGVPLYTTETSWDDSEISLMFRFAGGINFLVGENFWLGGELGLTPYLGDIDDATLSIMLGATMRL